jgi:hypothetical protein
MTTIQSIGITALLSTCMTAVALADTLWNKQGGVIEGEVLSDEPNGPVVFRCKHKGEWRTFEIARDQIQKYKREPGDQSDGNGWPEGESEGTEQASSGGATAKQHTARKLPESMLSCNQLRPLLKQLVPETKKGVPEIVVLHLSGPFASANIFNVGSIISSGEFRVLMDFASERNPSAIVLRINSGGGYVDEMDRIIERLLQEQDAPKSRRVVAWVELGGSAAALTAIACREVVMMSHGRLGAATKTNLDGEAIEPPETALEQKQAAMRDARRRQIASLTGRPLAIQDAMEKPELRLWHHPVLGFSLEEQDESEWEAYDTDESRPLALDAKSAVDLGVAVGIANDTDALLAVLDLPSRTQVTDVDLSVPEFQASLTSARDFAKSGNQAVEGFKKRVSKEIDDSLLAMRAATGIRAATDGYTFNDFRVFRSAVVKLQSPSIDSRTREYLKEVDPDLLKFYELKLADAQRMFKRARQSTEDASRAGGISIGAILGDIELARNYLLEVQIGSELPK